MNASVRKLCQLQKFVWMQYIHDCVSPYHRLQGHPPRYILEWLNIGIQNCFWNEIKFLETSHLLWFLGAPPLRRKGSITLCWRFGNIQQSRFFFQALIGITHNTRLPFRGHGALSRVCIVAGCVWQRGRLKPECKCTKWTVTHNPQHEWVWGVLLEFT